MQAQLVLFSLADKRRVIHLFTDGACLTIPDPGGPPAVVNAQGLGE